MTLKRIVILIAATALLITIWCVQGLRESEPARVRQPVWTARVGRPVHDNFRMIWFPRDESGAAITDASGNERQLRRAVFVNATEKSQDVWKLSDHGAQFVTLAKHWTPIPPVDPKLIREFLDGLNYEWGSRNPGETFVARIKINGNSIDSSYNISAIRKQEFFEDESIYRVEVIDGNEKITPVSFDQKSQRGEQVKVSTGWFFYVLDVGWRVFGSAFILDRLLRLDRRIRSK